jgi:GH15 family glucan-1,4-alpha-glucosidase
VLEYSHVHVAQPDLTTVARYMFWLMFRNVASDGQVFHSDHFELSEQFDATTGFEKSVSNLSWSYAAFLSAVRARSLIG